MTNAKNAESDSTYAAEVESIKMGFEYEYCEICARDLDAHTIAPDALGHAHSYCSPISAERFIGAVLDLRSEDRENTEYDRALVEVLKNVLGFPEDRERFEDMLRSAG